MPSEIADSSNENQETMMNYWLPSKETLFRLQLLVETRDFFEMDKKARADKNGSTWPVFLWQFFASKSLWASESFKSSCHRMYLSKISIMCILLYEFLNDLDAESDFDENFITKKAGQVEPFLS